MVLILLRHVQVMWGVSYVNIFQSKGSIYILKRILCFSEILAFSFVTVDKPDTNNLVKYCVPVVAIIIPVEFCKCFLF